MIICQSAFFAHPELTDRELIIVLQAYPNEFLQLVVDVGSFW